MLCRAGLGAMVAGLGVAGCGSSHHKHHTIVSPVVVNTDITVLNELLGLEQEAAAAYTAGIPLLSGPIVQDCRQFLNDEIAHAGELYSLIKRQGGTPVKPRQAYSLGSPRSRGDVLALFHSIEQRQIAAYLAAIPLVTPGGARAALGAILGSDAQHVALIRGALGERPLAGAFVTGVE
jgi:hypothetical protein